LYIIDNDTAAGWVKAAMNLCNSTLVWVVYRGQQADGTSSDQTPMCGGRSYLPLGGILPPPAEDMINDIGGESDDDGDKRCLNEICFPSTKSGIQTCE